jgi:membrane fusion protein (multidrug efflux system)
MVDTENTPDSAAAPAPRRPKRSALVPVTVTCLTLVVLGAGRAAMRRAEEQSNPVSLSESKKAVTVVEARATEYRGARRYVGTLEPWHKADIGPQLVSGFVGSVLVRPGDKVKRGAVLATLDCRNASASSKAVQLEARALEARQRAAAREATRVEEMLQEGYASSNEVEQKLAQTAATEAQIEGLKAQLESKLLQVDDCVMRAPFAGEVSRRWVDPGAFARPGSPIVTLIDRDVVRIALDVPERDFALVEPGKIAKVTVLSLGRTLSATIARRSPEAEPSTRTIHVELDLSDAKRQMPVGTTAMVEVEMEQSRPALELPLSAARIKGDSATLFVLQGDRAEKLQASVLGERDGKIFVEPSFPEGTKVVSEGRSLLANGDAVTSTLEASE